MKKCNFDERQLFIRGNIFKHVTIIMAALLILNAFLMDNGIIWADAIHSNFIILLISVAFGSIEMIFKEAYIQKNSAQKISVILIGILSGALIILSLIDFFVVGDKFIARNQLTHEGGTFIVSVLLFSIFVGFIIKSIILIKAKKEE
ncbi:MAG TPA: hypothetical protein VIO64_00150 [Pseudobacteroides sp.]|uniref:hypothetical protein n=1 Tax=Pseudobacteroides sp. TaxID=1968840 RepID=UPI002F93068A